MILSECENMKLLTELTGVDDSDAQQNSNQPDKDEKASNHKHFRLSFKNS